ncbi:hypothetical protein Pint_08597 [Pistacia integerrima]|uniref:Uncharacterized protein n=1 Tax=Pistacia integerrima TaxID=434235 RepID=A0ACC0XTH9_9ROSI|nr:hypothetical protein Pint_08597 [Pistacia integerrima]
MLVLSSPEFVCLCVCILFKCYRCQLQLISRINSRQLKKVLQVGTELKSPRFPNLGRW